MWQETKEEDFNYRVSPHLPLGGAQYARRHGQTGNFSLTLRRNVYRTAVSWIQDVTVGTVSDPSCVYLGPCCCCCCFCFCTQLTREKAQSFRYSVSWVTYKINKPTQQKTEKLICKILIKNSCTLLSKTLHTAVRNTFRSVLVVSCRGASLIP